jgi:sugar lactone lactonase YvrE
MTSTRLTRWSHQTFQLAECPRWTGDRLLLVDILRGDLYECAGECPGEPRRILHIDEPLGAVAPLADRADTWIAAVGRGIALIQAGGTLEWLARMEPAGHRMNDGVCDPAGRFWAGSMSYDGRRGAGSLYRVDHDGAVEKVWDDISIANGPAFNAEGRLMYLSDSARGVILRFEVDPVSGSITEPDVFAQIRGGSPDGLTVDSRDGLWAAVWGSGEVRRYTSDSEQALSIRLPVPQPTAVCLGGSGRTRLFITSASHGLECPPPGSGALWSAEVDVPGPPAVHYCGRTSDI